MPGECGEEVGQVPVSIVADVIDFQASENTTWRLPTAERNENQTTVEEMIEDIVKSQRHFRKMKNKVSKEQLETVKHDFLITFIYHLNREEDHGLGTKEETEEFLVGESSNRRNGKLSVEEQETLNIYNAYEKLTKIVEQECDEDESLYGFIEGSLVKELHKIILNDLTLPKGMTKPGECSNRDRFTTFQGQVHFYKKPDDMEVAMNTILDQYNSLVNWLKSEKDEKTKVEKLFKTSSWLLFEFLDLHPFSDGNGRLGRLLCSYAMSVLTPFASPIYDIWSQSTKYDYVKALVEARNSKSRHPEALTTMLIECNWLAWKEFTKQLQETTPKKQAMNQ